MKPGLPMHDSASMGFANVEVSGNRSNVCTSLGDVHLTDSLYNIRRVLIGSTFFPSSVVSMASSDRRDTLTAFTNHISHIVSVGT